MAVQWDIFLAHAGADKEYAEQLYDALFHIAPDIRVFLDCKTLVPGDNWMLELPKAQRAARMTVVLVSSRVEAAYYVQEEIATAVAMSREVGQQHRLVPVHLEGAPGPSSNVPYGLRVLHGIDALQEGWPDGVARRLVEALAGLPVGAPVVPEPTFDLATVYAKLIRLLPSQLDAVVMFSGLDPAYLNSGAAPATRAVELVLQAGQRPDGGRKLTDALGKVTGGR